MRWRDILNPWGALREARAEIERLNKGYHSLNENWFDAQKAALHAGGVARSAIIERNALRAELDLWRPKQMNEAQSVTSSRAQCVAPKRDAKGRFVG
ncbi:hypothetical protein Tasa_041_034 [Tanticharoenia sakaeratensis NBRC 103193]|uniref:Uncharacterized protein n=1 Tax=Tanticharoenia sakaeratensis NBRC 103193 TaxID=1231623 RepID=A0A0D6MNJ8_9PROT|nr:hypothetical protein Tasa_041_034 [Tanticharoenia sakaeratensis NBRC 103193]GBQ23329.1 hypothetical protein AA103193_2377 [Tanticharoenia sakaeratensis NBRC 103193]